MIWQDANSLSVALEGCFNNILQQRMRDIPVINPKLQVQAIDFQSYQDIWLGVLLTPWFMNILIVDDKTELATGKKISRLFPSGSYEFIISSEQAIGCYQSCSLYSPMFAFEQQSVAVETAKEALRYLLLAPEQPGLSRRDLLRGQFSRRNGVD